MKQLLSGLELRSLLNPGGKLQLSLEEVAVPEPGDDEIVVRVQAAPINPSDLGLLLGAADVGTAKATGAPGRAVTSLEVPSTLVPSMAGRVGQSLPVGTEGAGVVVTAGTSPQARALLGRTVAVLGGAMYARYRRAKAGDCLPLPAGATAVEGASCFVNPLTALGMIDTMRTEGHAALVNTAAASNLGQMLNRICMKDGIALVNVVRSATQVEILRAIGAEYVCDSTAPDFPNDLATAIGATRATLAFDAIGGGRLVSQILAAMEAAAVANVPPANYSRYGSTVHKQAYIYGSLDPAPTELGRGFGFAWGVGGWLLTAFLATAGTERLAALKARVAAELTTTFASRYTRTLSLAAVLDPKNIVEYAKRATGEKYLVDPAL